MIPVHPEPEPFDFDLEVRQTGTTALLELVGQPSQRQHGRPFAKIADRFEEIPTGRLPTYWRRALPDLRDAYRDVCAYTGIHLDPITGAATVDHFVAKSKDRLLAYEWANLRLASAFANARKGDAEDVLDPFSVEDGWFRLELVDYQVLPAPDLEPETRDAVLRTLERLGLNDYRLRRHRAEQHQAYLDCQLGQIELAERYPFLARELERQGAL